VLTEQSSPATAWTTVNAAECMPGLQSPLAWTVWGDIAERALRRGFYDLGVLSRRELAAPSAADDRVIGVFFGYSAGNVNVLSGFADRSPGTSGEAFQRQVFGRVRPEIVSRKSYRRYPMVLAKSPVTTFRLAGRLRRLNDEVGPWWAQQTSPAVLADEAGAAARFSAAAAVFERAFALHISARMLGQGLYDRVAQLAAAVGLPGHELSLTGGSAPLPETAMLADLFAVGRGRLELAEFLARHGYHGPAEGDLSARSWREDPTPIERLLSSYRTLGDDAHPDQVMQRQLKERQKAERELLAALPASRRAAARATLALARHIIPLGEIGKMTFLKALDCLRAAARSHGRHLVALGVIDAPDEVFLLTAEEAFTVHPADARSRAAERRTVLERYAILRLPDVWVGVPAPQPRQQEWLDGPDDGTTVATAAGAGAGIAALRGVAASPGVVEGAARVVIALDELGELEPGEVLVCEMTDPSWASYMLIASALVADIGGPVSHAAIVARELGLPCVVNTGRGTQVISTGDVVRVDGSAGSVEILKAS
jgi:pyruvate,water dikinase